MHLGTESAREMTRTKRDVPDGQSTYTSDRVLMNSPSAKNQHHRSNHRDYRFPDTIEDSRRYPNQRGEEIGYFPKAKHILNDSENDDGRATGLGRAGRNDGGAAAASMGNRLGIAPARLRGRRRRYARTSPDRYDVCDDSGIAGEVSRE